MNIQEQVSAFQKKRNEASERQRELMSRASDEGRTLDDEESSEYDGLATEVKHVDAHLARLRDLSGDDDGSKKEVKTNGPTILVRKTDKEDEFPGQSFVRKLIAEGAANLENYRRSPGQIAEHRWGKTHPNLVKVIKSGIVTKADVSGGGTESGEWGAELVGTDNRYTGDFLEFLHAMTVYDRLPLRVVPANVSVKGQDGTGVGYWVGQSKAIPVSALSFSTTPLTPLKAAALSVVSNELIKHSSPAAEMLIRDSLAKDSAQVVDTTFLSTDAAVTGVSPAGLLVTPLADLGSNGNDAAALRKDILELYAPFITAKHASNLYLVMNPARAKATSLMVNTLGQTEFPGLSAGGGSLLGDQVVTGDNVPAGMVILLDPREIWRIEDGGVEVSLSRDATIEMGDGDSVVGDSEEPTASSYKPVSMYQTESTAFKVVRPINYQKRRSTAVAYIGDAGWGDTASTTA